MTGVVATMTAQCFWAPAIICDNSVLHGAANQTYGTFSTFHYANTIAINYTITVVQLFIYEILKLHFIKGPIEQKNDRQSSSMLFIN